MNKKLTFEQRIATLEGLFSNAYEDAMKDVRKMRLIIDDINGKHGFAHKLAEWFKENGYDNDDEDIKYIFSYVHEIEDNLEILEKVLANPKRLKKFLGE